MGGLGVVENDAVIMTAAQYITWAMQAVTVRSLTGWRHRTGGAVGIFRRQVPPQRKELVTMFFSDVVTIPPCPRPASAPASLDSLFPTAAGHLD